MKIFNDDWLNNKIPDKSINLIIADPPYFEVKGDFDFKWKSFDGYLKDVESWAVECKRVLANNGCLFWWGHAKKIAYSQIIFDKYFKLENNLVWHKIDAQTNKINSNEFRTFRPVTERLLFYSNESEDRGGSGVFDSIIEYMNIEREKAGLKTCDQINKILGTAIGGGGMAGHYFNGNKIFELPTKEMYSRLQTTGYFQRPYDSNSKESLKNEYLSLKEEYELLRRPFNLELYNLNDIISAIQDSNISKDYDHETIKPLTLTKKLIQTTTRKGDTVLIPFGGSGTDVAACIDTDREYICYEIAEKHFNTIKKREKKALLQPELFNN